MRIPPIKKEHVILVLSLLLNLLGGSGVVPPLSDPECVCPDALEPAGAAVPLD